MRALQEAMVKSAPRPAHSVSGLGKVTDILNHYGGTAGVEAAKWTPNRGTMDYAPLDTSRVLTGGARKTVLRKCRWLAINDGYARFLVNGLANLIGFYQLQPATKDKAWNAIAERHWKNRIKTPSVFDRLGKFNHARWQLALSRGSIRDGDILTLKTYAQSGAGQILIYGGHQIDSGNKQDIINLRDGIYHDNLMAHTGYNLVNPSDLSKSTVVRASNAMYYGDFSDAAELRPMPRFTHAVNDLHDIAEIDLDSKLGIKRRQFIGLYKKRAHQNISGNLGLGVYQSPHTETGANVTNTSAAGVETTQTTLINVEGVTDRTGIATLEAGEDYGVVSADNPGPNEREFNKALLTKISLGLGLPPSTVFAMLGAGGPEVRFHMALLQRWIQIELLNLLTIVQQHYFWIIGTDIARGALPEPDDEQWWNNIAIPCADLTIDRGRELNGKIAALKVGALTHADIFAEAGKDWEDQLEIQAEIIAHASGLAAQKGLAGGLSDLMPDWNPRRPAITPLTRP
jgi:hypothetical protein